MIAGKVGNTRMAEVWMGIILMAIIGISLTIFFVRNAIEAERIGKRIWWIYSTVVIVIFTFAICFGLHWRLYNTESGKRAVKDFQSDTQGGIERVVTVYDISGDMIAQYSGKFDVESNDTRIKFDDEDGERHIIYFTTGTVTIDEVAE